MLIVNMATFYLIVSIYVALYLAIWMHEVGHALAYWKFGCKRNPWKVKVPFYLLRSTPAPVAEACANRLSALQQLVVAVSGVVVNCLFGILALWVVLLVDSLAAIPLLYVFLYFFSLSHLLEAGSYLVVNNLFLGSDMALIVAHAPKSRWPVFALASLTLLPATALLVREAPRIGYALFGTEALASTWRLGVALLSVLIIMTMGVARVLYSRGRECLS